ncbi:MAG TPA: carbohydrate ABC transporter permease [Spirochaetia bacterium]|nr:carbohydrate ABC transporter permease [Spirochaetia bacterium]
MKRKNAKSAAQYGALSLVFACFALPLLWLALASFDPNADQIIKIPGKPTLANYVSVLGGPENLQGFLNSLLLAGLQSVVDVAVAFLAAYPLSRFQLSWKRHFLYVIVFMTALPLNAIMIPVFKLFISCGIQNNLVTTSLFMAAANLPYGIWMMKNFMDDVPVSLEEAAWVDGAGKLKAMRKIVVPLMVPGLCTVLIYVFTAAWGNFFVPFILLQDAAKFPASIRIYQYFQLNGLVEYGKLAAYSVVYMVPSVVLYALTQQFMSKGFAMGGADR